MESPSQRPKIAISRQPRSPQGKADLEVVRPAKTIDDPAQPHCADHALFHPSCPICKRACANFQPYPVRRTAAPTRSFGYTDDLTEATLRALNPRNTEFYSDDPKLSLAWNILRILRRLIWPF